jgi:tetratricopeptide (TPR) repeat protein
MSKKKKSEKHIHNTVPVKKELPTPQWIIPFILILTFAAFIPVLNAGFVNWDDPDYVNNNILIRDFSNLSEIITTPIQGNYHPLTMLSLAINYAISGLDSWSYHLFNLIFHLINCFLVFRLAMLLSNKNIVIAFTTSLLFGVHPMHVESVAWVTERKDVLYTLFFLAGLISYTKYVDTKSKKQYAYTLLFLILSLLSKPAAVVFPLVVFCIDLLRSRQLTFKLLIEKIPFLIPALISAILTYNAQTDVGATGAVLFSMSTRILMAFYGIMMYIIKLIAPFNLSPFYPFPPATESLPVSYYIGPVFFIALAVLFYFSMKKNRVFAFGISFYLANLILVLQILPVGSAVISERYTYIPYIGLFYALGWFINKFTNNNYKKAFYIIIPISILFSIITFKQAGVWHSGATLWDHAIKTQPSAQAFAQRAMLLRKEGNQNLALEYYNNAIKLNIIYHEAYTNRGNVYLDQNKLDLAFTDYKKALSIKPDYHVAHDNMGALFAIQRKYDSALIYLDQAIRLKPDYKPSYLNRALTYMEVNRYNDAIKDFETYLVYEPEAADIYNSIGLCYRVQSKFQESLAPINKAIQMNPQPPFFMNRSYAYYGLKNLEQAKKDALIARQGGITIEANYAKILGLE